MRKKWKGLVGIGIVTGCLMLFGCNQTPTDVEEQVKVQAKATEEVKNATPNVEYLVPKKDGLKVYTKQKQEKVKREIEKKLEEKTYTVEKPLVYYNPFGTNLRSANVYFTTKQACRVSYTISVQDKTIKDFTRNLKNEGKSGVTKNHGYQLIGLIPNKENTIRLKLYNKEGKQIAQSSFMIRVPKVNSNAEQKLKVQEVKKGTQTDGLFCVMYGRSSGKLPNICLYDNDGVLRAELPVESYRTDRILTVGNNLYYSVGYSKVVKVNRLGEVKQIYDLGNYTMHHDFVYEKSKNALLILASEKNQKTVEDIVLKLDLQSGKVTELVDLKEILPKEYKKAKKPEKKTVLDWAHVNTIQSVNGTDIILSFRELSSIVKIQNVYTKPKLQYILCDQDIWNDSAYKNYVYEKVGKFTSQAGQHTVTYIPGKTESEYRLSMFNNNLTYSGTRKDIDWSGYTLSQVPVEERNSYYYEYKVNEKEKTFELVKSFAVPYSGYVSSTEQVGNNYIVCSGSPKVFGEYDNEGNLLKEYKISGDRHLYRVFKYTFEGSWFAK